MGYVLLIPCFFFFLVSPLYTYFFFSIGFAFISCVSRFFQVPLPFRVCCTFLHYLLALRYRDAVVLDARRYSWMNYDLAFYRVVRFFVTWNSDHPPLSSFCSIYFFLLLFPPVHSIAISSFLRDIHVGRDLRVYGAEDAETQGSGFTCT
ncbi:hypothetical protein ASPBRDRAFT_264420 [Aspergillus brasiliensis CBS 101740]|uniref:Uncharacterized protein n=1 Tax=Aspergillus brasiliensis (strain CBS 101740 / IMI 381727 / IBT 21946) TaxID=767769 RepID=A0A1L9V377_ASPBC|nr:hypothetical protein ASPBRDRAFT_264420 [Aspergillus brasiliensis CBS 101740]